MDKFVAKMQHEIGGGGLHCPCCNTKSPHRRAVARRKARILRKLARRTIKKETRRLLIEAIG